MGTILNRGAVILVVLLILSSGQAMALSFQELVERARREAAERPLTVYSINPRSEAVREAVFEAFRKQYNLAGFRTEWLLLHPTEAANRLIAEARARRPVPDVVSSGFASFLEVDRHPGILEPFDWVGVFKGEFPGIKEAAVERVPEKLRGKSLVYFDATRSFVFNTRLIKMEEVPEQIEELADPRWRRRFVIGGSSPFDLFVLVWGKERTLETVRRLLANEPIFARGTPAVNVAVSTGQAPVGLGGMHDAERLKARGEPVDWKAYGEYMPVLSIHMAVPRGARSPHLARLFTAWIAMGEGMNILEKREFRVRVSREGSPMERTIRKRVPNLKVFEPTTPEELVLHVEMREKITSMLAAGR